MDDYEGRQIVFYRDVQQFCDAAPREDYNVGVVYQSKDGVKVDLRGYLHFRESDWRTYLYVRDACVGSAMHGIQTWDASTSVSDMTSVLYSMILLGMDDGETDLEKEARNGE